MIAWWTLKWYEQIFPFVVLDWNINARLRMLVWSGLFYSYYPEVFSFAHYHILLRSLFSTLDIHLHWILAQVSQQFCVMSPMWTRAIQLTFLRQFLSLWNVSHAISYEVFLWGLEIAYVTILLHFIEAVTHIRNKIIHMGNLKEDL